MVSNTKKCGISHFVSLKIVLENVNLALMNDTSLKAQIRNLAKSCNTSAQAVLQNYLMSRFLYRMSMSKYKDN